MSKKLDLSHIQVKMVARRYELGMTQYDLAEAMGTTQGQVSALENGRSKSNPTLSTMLRWCDALKMNYLMDVERPEEAGIDAVLADD